MEPGFAERQSNTDFLPGEQNLGPHDPLHASVPEGVITNATVDGVLVWPVDVFLFGGLIRVHGVGNVANEATVGDPVAPEQLSTTT